MRLTSSIFNVQIILNNDTPTKPLTQPMSSEFTPPTNHLANHSVSSVDALDLNNLDFSPLCVKEIPMMTPKEEVQHSYCLLPLLLFTTSVKVMGQEI